MRAQAPLTRRARILGCSVIAIGSTIAAGLIGSPSLAGTGTSPQGSVTAALAQPVVGGAATPSGNGWWQVAADGGIFAYGDAAFRGSTGGLALNRPIVGMAATRTGRGYWLVASDGGIFSFGDAVFYGSTGGLALNRPIVGMAATRTGRGYWLVASDGGIFSFGDAVFYGSTGAIRLVSPVVGMAVAHGGGGYWLVAADGGVFAFAEAPFAGSAAGDLSGRAAGLVATSTGGGYWIADAAGRVFPFGDATAVGDAVGALGAPIVGMAAQAGPGLRLITSDGASAGLSPTGVAISPSATPPPPGSYSWMIANADGSPVRFNPCAPIHYVVNAAEGPANAASLVTGAFARLGAATGITFVSDGSTTEMPTAERPSSQARYGAGWAPIIVAWARPSETDLLPGGNTIGEGGSWWVMPEAKKIYVTGAVVIDPANTANLLASFGAGSSLGELLLHELGHVVGLGHTPDRSQVMFPTILPLAAAAYGVGDLAGLAQLGRSAGCLAEPAP
ncbi:MAG: matrixin family metalloprotease [Acidimicrobiales bacterium]